MKFMSKISKILMISFMIVFFCLGSVSSAASGKAEIDVKFRGQIVSAEFQGVSLRLILENLKKEKVIWFRGDEFLLDEKVSVQFKDLPLHEGLGRILSCINHVLVFEQDKGVVGLFILGKKNPGRPVARKAAIASEKAFPPQPVEEATVSRNPFKIFTDAPPPGYPKTKSMDTTIRKHFSPPEGPKTEMSDRTFMKISPSPKNPFANSFGASLSPNGQ